MLDVWLHCHRVPSLTCARLTGRNDCSLYTHILPALSRGARLVLGVLWTVVLLFLLYPTPRLYNENPSMSSHAELYNHYICSSIFMCFTILNHLFHYKKKPLHDSTSNAINTQNFYLRYLLKQCERTILDLYKCKRYSSRRTEVRSHFPSVYPS